MRIISGKYKGYRFPEHKLNHTRPTTDRAKESLFNILDQRVALEGMEVLDLYAGTGNMGFEFMSRGAAKTLFVEQNQKNVTYLKHVHDQLLQRDTDSTEMKIVKSRVIPFLKRDKKKYDLIFADPPYDSSDYTFLPSLIYDGQKLNKGGLFILEHSSMRKLTHPLLSEQRVYGQSTFSFFTFE